MALQCDKIIKELKINVIVNYVAQLQAVYSTMKCEKFSKLLNKN